MLPSSIPTSHTRRLPLGVGLAPMEGVTSFAMRVWFYLVSAPDSMGTPFLRVTDTFPWRELPLTFAPELTGLAGEVPYRLVPQLMATDRDDVLRVARYFPGEHEFIELNCGCPSPTCVGKGAGSSLLKDPEVFAEMTGELAMALGPGRFAIKMRTGYQGSEEFPRLLAAIRSLPLARLTVHGRSRPDRYKGRARWDLIDVACRQVSVPVVASGDITCARSFTELLDVAPLIQGALIGRGALRNPWIFAELRQDAPVRVSREALVHAIGCYVLLHELDVTAPAKLHRVARSLFARGSCGTSETRWRETFSGLAEVLTDGGRFGLGADGAWPDIALGRNTLGRAKMLWNYLRSGLPEFMFAPHILRAKSLGDLLTTVHHLAGEAGDTGLLLRHRPEVDWLYAGGRDPEQSINVVQHSSSCQV